MAPQTGLADQDQIGLPQVGQVPGNSRLRGAKDFHDVSDAEFPALQDVENPQPRSVGERPEHQVDAIHYLDLSGLGHVGSQGLVFVYCTVQGHSPCGDISHYYPPRGGRQALAALR